MAGRGRPGPAPKPNAAKRAAGNPGKRPLPEPIAYPEVLDPIPDAPEHLSAPGRAAWTRLWEARAPWMRPSRHYELVLLLCQSYDQQAWLLAQTARDGATFTTEKGYVGVHPALTELRKIDQQIATLLSLAGLTPSDESRLGLAEAKTRSRLADLRTRMAEGKAVASPVARTRKSTKKD